MGVDFKIDPNLLANYLPKKLKNNANPCQAIAGLENLVGRRLIECPCG
jgi:hypothetical protein